MKQTYKVHSVTDFEGDRRELLLTPVNLFEFVDLPPEDAPQADQEAADAAHDTLEAEYGGEELEFADSRKGGILAYTRNPSIRPGQWLRFTAEIVSPPKPPKS